MKNEQGGRPPGSPPAPPWGSLGPPETQDPRPWRGGDPWRSLLGGTLGEVRLAHSFFRILIHH